MKDQRDNDAQRLVGGDFSGIQPYIYQITSKYAKRNLKGRSFYLQLLSDSIVRYLLSRLKLGEDNVICNAGGCFCITMPDTEECVGRLRSSIEHIEETMLQYHGTSLYVAIDSVVLERGALGDTFEKLFARRDAAKQHRYSALLKKQKSTFFQPICENYNIVDCVTGAPFAMGEQAEQYKGSKDVLSPLQHVTKLQLELGQILSSASKMAVRQSRWDSPPDGSYHIEPLGLGFHYYFFNQETQEGDGMDMSSFYSGTETDGRGKKYSFEEMIDGLEDENKGAFRRLGVLRMDVDNLGHTFQNKAREKNATLEGYSDLSRRLADFFGGHLHAMWSAYNPARCQIVYSGGDDLFMVGRWDVVLEFAEKVASAFRTTFPGYTISGGVAVIEIKSPIMKGAEQAGYLEDVAKDHVCGDRSKNSMAFLGMALNWEEEYPIVKRLKDTFLQLESRKAHALEASLRGKIIQHIANAHMDKHKICNPKTYWMLSYDLGRLRSRYCGAESQDIRDLISNCITEVCHSGDTLNGTTIKTHYHAIELWALAARWAELEQRTN